MLNIYTGDAISAFIEKYDILIHGCNCFHTMGAGIAKTLSRKWPVVLKTDKQTKYGEKSKLGTISWCSVEPGKIVINAYTQYNPGKDLNVTAFKEAFIKVYLAFGKLANKQKICCPAVGMGIVGGNPEILLPMLNEIFSDFPLDMYVLDEEIKNDYYRFV